MSSRSDVLKVGNVTYTYYPVNRVAGHDKLPFSLTVLLENILRNAESDERASELAQRLVEAGLSGEVGSEIEFSPARVLFQDFTGVPVFVDFAVMREACMALGGDPKTINPQVQCDLVIDHSVIADEAGCAGALQKNMELEFDRNKERYEFLKWAQESFENVRIVPPGAGICHQLNIERFASVTMTKDDSEGPLAYFDTLVGTDSHTPTANGIGVLGWGVGGIEAEAAALGQPITTLVPRVIGIKLSGSLQPGVSAMDVSLTFAQMLRAEGVVGCFVECFGEGLESLNATQRACISNMTPEYGATCTLFPVDQKTLDYLELTGRSAEQIALVESYAKAQGFWNDPQSEPRTYSKVLELDLSKVQRSVAGPSRPHDRIDLVDVKNRFSQLCSDRSLDCSKKVSVDVLGQSYEVTHGALAIAAVTSCTTATDASMMISAGVLARNASKVGLHPKPWVKTILAPGSRATEDILDAAGLMLSGNRNFEGRISPDVSQNYLCAPALVIAYSLAGTIDFDFETEALGTDAEGNDIYLKDIWPDDEEVALLLKKSRTKEVFDRAAAGLFDGDERWQSLGKEASDVFAWDPDSTYVRRAPYFDGMEKDPVAPKSVKNARVLLNLGDFITTDHISPAGSIADDSPAARYLEAHGVKKEDFNTYGARRGNHEVMMRGAFANVKLQNKLAEGKRGGWTRDFIDHEIKAVYDAAEHYQEEGSDLVVLAGKMYGSILPLQFEEGQNAESLGLDGTERITVGEIDFSEGLPKPSHVVVTAEKPDGSSIEFTAVVRIDTPTEGSYYYNGGILQYVLRQLS